MAIGPLAAVLPWQDEQAEQQRGRYYGRYLGFVRDRNDPAKLGRVRVHLPTLLGADDSEDHWSDWALPSTMGLVVPPLGSPVYVTFEQGFVSHPIYTPGWITGNDASSSAAPMAGKEDGIDPTWTEQKSYTAGGAGGAALSFTIPQDTARETRPRYPYNKVYVSEGGHAFELDDSPGLPRARYYHPSGTTFLVDADGSVHVRTAGAIYYEAGGDFNIGLKEGSTFRVVYPGGTAFAVGAMGFHVKGHQASILGRTVQRNERDL